MFLILVSIKMQHRASKDSAMEDENCRSLSCLTDSTEQSAPINFDMSNRVRNKRSMIIWMLYTLKIMHFPSVSFVKKHHRFKNFFFLK